MPSITQPILQGMPAAVFTDFDSVSKKAEASLHPNPEAFNTECFDRAVPNPRKAFDPSPEACREPVEDWLKWMEERQSGHPKEMDPVLTEDKEQHASFEDPCLNRPSQYQNPKKALNCSALKRPAFKQGKSGMFSSQKKWNVPRPVDASCFEGEFCLEPRPDYARQAILNRQKAQGHEVVLGTDGFDFQWDKKIREEQILKDQEQAWKIMQARQSSPLFSHPLFSHPLFSHRQAGPWNPYEENAGNVEQDAPEEILEGEVVEKKDSKVSAAKPGKAVDADQIPVKAKPDSAEFAKGQAQNMADPAKAIFEPAKPDSRKMDHPAKPEQSVKTAAGKTDQDAGKSRKKKAETVQKSAIAKRSQTTKKPEKPAPKTAAKTGLKKQASFSSNKQTAAASADGQARPEEQAKRSLNLPAAMAQNEPAESAWKQEAETVFKEQAGQDVELKTVLENSRQPADCDQNNSALHQKTKTGKAGKKTEVFTQYVAEEAMEVVSPGFQPALPGIGGYAPAGRPVQSEPASSCRFLPELSRVHYRNDTRDVMVVHKDMVSYVPQPETAGQGMPAGLPAASGMGGGLDASMPAGKMIYVANQQVLELFHIPPCSWDPLTRASRTVWMSQGLLIDEFAHLVYSEGEILNVTKTEFELLLYIVKHSTISITRNALMVIIEGIFNRTLCDNTLSKHINRLRRKLGGSKDAFIKTCPGTGYKWRPQVEKLYIVR